MSGWGLADVSGAPCWRGTVWGRASLYPILGAPIPDMRIFVSLANEYLVLFDRPSYLRGWCVGTVICSVFDRFLVKWVLLNENTDARTVQGFETNKLNFRCTARADFR